MPVDTRLLKRWTHERNLRARERRLIELGVDPELAHDPYGELAATGVAFETGPRPEPRRVLFLVTDDR